MKYQLEYRASVKKELRKINKNDRGAIVKIILSLKNNAFPANSSKLKGSIDLYRIRRGDYRIVYQAQKGKLVILIVRVGHRKDIYKNL